MPSSGDHFRAIVGWTMPEQVDAANVLAFKMVSGTCTDSEFQTALAAYLTTAYGYLQGVVHNNVDIAEVKVVEVTWSVASWITTRLVGTISPSFTSTDSGEMLPHACSGVIVMPTSVPKRRGRVNIPGLTEAQQSDSLWVSGCATAMANFGAALRTGFSPGAGSANYYVLGNDGTSSYPGVASVNGLVGSQRSRKPGVGI